jgi:hypothetical protein
MKPTNRKKARTDRPTLPELEQTKRSVLNSLTSIESRRSYQHAVDEFVEWYCSGPRLALNRAVVLGYRLQLEAKNSPPQQSTSGSPQCAAWLTKRPIPGC